MARRSKRKVLAAGVVGAGKTSVKAMKQHLSDFIEAQDAEITWVLPFSDNSSKTMEQVIDFLYNEEATYELVSDGSVEDDDLYGYSSEFIELDEGEDSHMGVIARVAEFDDNAGVLILLDEALDADLDLMEAAQEEKLEVFDLCTALAPLTLEDAAPPEPDNEGEAAEEAIAAESDEDAPSASGVTMPDDVLTAISAGEVDEAVALLKALDKDDLVELAEEAGLAGPSEGDDPWKGIHRKTIAAELVGVLAEGAPAEEPEEEAPAPKKRASKKTAPKAEDPEPVEDESEVQDVPAEKLAQSPNQGSVNGHPRLDPHHLVSVLSKVYVEKGLAETKKFYSLLEEKELV